jgi:hypothetical protein
LREWPEDPFHESRLDTDAGIEDAEEQPTVFGPVPRQVHLQANLACRSEFHSIIDQIG